VSGLKHSRFGVESATEDHAAGRRRGQAKTGLTATPLALRRNLFAKNTVPTAKHSAEEETMDKEWAQEVAKSAAEQARKGANEAGPDVQSTLDRTKSMAQDQANRASEIGGQTMRRAGEFIEGVAPQAKEVASNLYDQGSQSGVYVRQYISQQPIAALLIAGAIGYTLGYLIHRP
jgi:ElaB/YqjD/DUF883 family membrane-anchored ribosome-binding protein